MVCVYVIEWASLCVGPRLELYKIAGVDAGNALAGLMSTAAREGLGTVASSKSGAGHSLYRTPLTIM